MDDKVQFLLDYLEKCKAKDVALFDIKDVKCQEDYVILANFDSTIENKLFADELMKKLGIQEFPEGYHRGEWIIYVLDKILLHTFIPAKREKYNLDKLYQNKKVVLEKPKAKKSKK